MTPHRAARAGDLAVIVGSPRCYDKLLNPVPGVGGALVEVLTDPYIDPRLVGPSNKCKMMDGSRVLCSTVYLRPIEPDADTKKLFEEEEKQFAFEQQVDTAIRTGKL